MARTKKCVIKTKKKEQKRTPKTEVQKPEPTGFDENNARKVFRP